jgi:hypothetical protein
MGTWESSGTPESLEFDWKGQNSPPWKVLYIIRKLLKCRCPKMGSHDPFGHLQHKLWPKERLGVKLAVWLPTMENQESTWFPCVQVACDMSLESSQRGIELWFRPRPDRRSAPEVIVLQSCGTPSFGDFRTPIWMPLPHSDAKYTIWGKVVASPESGMWWVLWVQNCPWLVLTPKVLQKMFWCRFE